MDMFENIRLCIQDPFFARFQRFHAENKSHARHSNRCSFTSPTAEVKIGPFS